MGADPEPDDLVAVEESERPIVHGDPSRVDRARWMDLLESETRVRGIVAEAAVGLASAILNI
jgi:hypothetical protein